MTFSMFVPFFLAGNAIELAVSIGKSGKRVGFVPMMLLAMLMAGVGAVENVLTAPKPNMTMWDLLILPMLIVACGTAFSMFFRKGLRKLHGRKG